jgi:hypothetical protein
VLRFENRLQRAVASKFSLNLPDVVATRVDAHTQPRCDLLRWHGITHELEHVELASRELVPAIVRWDRRRAHFITSAGIQRRGSGPGIPTLGDVLNSGEDVVGRGRICQHPCRPCFGKLLRQSLLARRRYQDYADIGLLLLQCPRSCHSFLRVRAKHEKVRVLHLDEVEGLRHRGRHTDARETRRAVEKSAQHGREAAPTIDDHDLHMSSHPASIGMSHQSALR